MHSRRNSAGTVVPSASGCPFKPGGWPVGNLQRPDRLHVVCLPVRIPTLMTLAKSAITQRRRNGKDWHSVAIPTISPKVLMPVTLPIRYPITTSLNVPRSSWEGGTWRANQDGQ